MYKKLSTPKDYIDLIERKEFQYLKKTRNYEIYEDYPEFLNIQNHQRFGSYYIHPNAPNKRILFKMGTGSGKTIAGICASKAFIEEFRNDYNSTGSSGSVVIIGFTQKLFQNDLMKFPELGIISHGEIEELERLRKLGLHINNMDPYKNKKRFIKRKMTDKSLGGFYKFYGYKEFANKLFMVDKDIDKLSKAELIEKLSSGEINLNKDILDMFDKNSIMICDEVHNIYNSKEPNNWGVAIQTILNLYTNIRAIFMSATPHNNSPEEIVDLMNLLVPITENAMGRMFLRSDFFQNGKLTSKGRENLDIYLKGRVMFLFNPEKSSYPDRLMMGEPLEGVKFLKFIKCPMSAFHQATYEQKEKEYGKDLKLHIEEVSLIDYALPNPESNTIGLYNVKDLSKIINASQAWKNKFEINGSYDHGGIVLTGKFLEDIKKYSTKYYTMLEMIKNTPMEKVLIYHNFVHGSGVLFIAEVLKYNGYIGKDESPSKHTLCAICSKPLSDHKKNIRDTEIYGDNVDMNPNMHQYYPARFVIITSELSLKDLEENKELFNMPDNAYGQSFKILIGSKKIKEGLEFKNVRHLFITSFPINIPTLIQVLGRCIRKGSHNDLSKDKWNVKVMILLSVFSRNSSKKTYEENRYISKWKSYLDILDIEKLMHTNAINGFIHGLNFVVPQLETLPFSIDSRYKKNYNSSELNRYTFNAYHNNDELYLQTHIIKVLFLKNKIWKYDDLWKAVKNFKYDLNVNTEMFDENIFIVALNNIITKKSNININIEDKYQSEKIYKSMFNRHNKVITDGTKNYVVRQRGEYFILVEKDAPVIFNSFLMAQNTLPTIINLESFVKDKNVGSNTAEFLNNYWKKDWFDKYNKKFYICFTEKAIRGILTKSAPSDMRKLYIDYLDTLALYGKVLYGKDVAKIANIRYSPLSIVGHTIDIPRYYSCNDKTFINEPRLAKKDVRSENDIIIGILGNGSFKIRSSIKANEDKRKVERGAECYTKSKEYLLNVLQRLEIKHNIKKTEELCELLKQELINREKKGRKQGNLRWVYFPFD
jgi:superfamily II DNA or RNA helicase